MVNQDADGYTKTLHRWKILKNKLTENQKNAKTAYKLSGGPFFTFSLPGGGNSPLWPPVSYTSGRQTFSHGGPVLPGIILQSGPQSNNDCLEHANLLQLVLNMAQIHREIWAYVAAVTCSDL